jgi:chromate transport protein ChrA
MKHLIKGITPAVGMLLALIAWQLFQTNKSKSMNWRSILLATLSFMALYSGIPPQYVLIGAGVLGVFLFR